MKDDRVIHVPVEIWLSDVMDELADKELEAELRSRGLSSSTRDAVLDALIMLKTGRIDDGIAALEAEFFPRYADAAECKRRYEQEMGLGEARRAAA